MLAKIWKKLLMLVLILACMFNIITKLVNNLSLDDKLLSSAQYIQKQHDAEKEEDVQKDDNKSNVEEKNEEQVNSEEQEHVQEENNFEEQEYIVEDTEEISE